MQNRPRYGQALLLVTALSSAGCQLPSIVPKVSPAAGSPVGSPIGGVNDTVIRTQTIESDSNDIVIPLHTSRVLELPTSSRIELFLRHDSLVPD